MKIGIKNLVSKNFLGKEEIKKHKDFIKIILLFFALCTISFFLILGYKDAINMKENNNEYTPAFNDTYVYEILELDLLEYEEKVGDVSENRDTRKDKR
ncbi:MAG: hypothetical protein E7602_05620 [Ruminococcaceae bacterium]|nr:hypothetical protein [Oscillospiraceae bacterium]